MILAEGKSVRGKKASLQCNVALYPKGTVHHTAPSVLCWPHHSSSDCNLRAPAHLISQVCMISYKQANLLLLGTSKRRQDRWLGSRPSFCSLKNLGKVWYFNGDFSMKTKKLLDSRNRSFAILSSQSIWLTCYHYSVLNVSSCVKILL